MIRRSLSAKAKYVYNHLFLICRVIFNVLSASNVLIRMLMKSRWALKQQARLVEVQVPKEAGLLKFIIYLKG